MIKVISVLITLLLPFIFPNATSAHAFGQLYNLPIPFWMYLYGGAAAIVVSFLIIGFFFNNNINPTNYPKRDISKNLFVRFLNARKTVALLKVLSVFLLFLTIISGFIGTNRSTANFNMTFFWIIFVLGLMYFTALFGNVWAILNPLKIIADKAETLWPKLIKGNTKYPEKLGYYPALLLYFIFIWIELFFGTTPFSLSFLILYYFVFNIYGVLVFGKKDWFKYGEFFSVLLRLIGKIALFENDKGVVYARPPFVGLLKGKAEQLSLLFFIIFMLSSTAFDGFHNTQIFYDLIPVNVNSYLLSQTIGLAFSLVFFLLIYLILMFLAKLITKSAIPLRNLALQFSFSLIPIALVYNIAHYYTLLLTQGQTIIRLISDPFGFGWDLFHSAGYEINYAVIDMNFIWHSQIAFILVGHIAAVYIAHIIALRTFPTHKKALLSQIPMLILMVVYTMIGLWILAQQVTNG